MAGFDGIKPIVTADRNGSFARLDLPTGRSGYFFYETQGNCKVAKSMRILNNKIKKKYDDDNNNNSYKWIVKKTKQKHKQTKAQTKQTNKLKRDGRPIHVRYDISDMLFTRHKVSPWLLA